MPTFAISKAGYRNMWDKCQILPAKLTAVNAAAKKIMDKKSVYEAVGICPWFMIGAIHYREADFDFNTYLGNGDPLNISTIHVPRGHGPFPNWEAGAKDALEYDGFNEVKFDSIEQVLYSLEAYNGWGYTSKGVNSPYVWGGTNLQEPGKYVADGKWDASVMDSQLGCAAIIKAIAAADTEVAEFCGAGAPPVVAVTVPAHIPATVVTTTPATVPAPIETPIIEEAMLALAQAQVAIRNGQPPHTAIAAGLRAIADAIEGKSLVSSSGETQTRG
jgi:lysozyme family protein